MQMLPPIENWCLSKNLKSYGWLYQRPQRLWAFLKIVAANVGTKEDVYAEKLSYCVMNFASVRGNVTHELFLFEAYIVTKNIFLFDILFVMICLCTEL